MGGCNVFVVQSKQHSILSLSKNYSFFEREPQKTIFPRSHFCPDFPAPKKGLRSDCKSRAVTMAEMHRLSAKKTSAIEWANRQVRRSNLPRDIANDAFFSNDIDAKRLLTQAQPDFPKGWRWLYVIRQQTPLLSLWRATGPTTTKRCLFEVCGLWCRRSLL